MGYEARSRKNNFHQRDFLAGSLSQKWVDDITCFPTGKGWLYLTVIDLADRKVVGCL